MHERILTGFTLPVTEAGPSAFANIQENYYYVFVGCTLFFFIVAYMYFPYVSSDFFPSRSSSVLC